MGKSVEEGDTECLTCSHHLHTLTHKYIYTHLQGSHTQRCIGMHEASDEALHVRVEGRGEGEVLLRVHDLCNRGGDREGRQ